MNSILIIEDDPIQACQIKELLETHRSDIAAEIAYSAQDAMDKVCDQVYDLFLINLHLEEPMGGYPLALAIRKEGHAMTPILIASTDPYNALRMYEEVHCYQYLVKPYDFRQLLEMLEEIFCSEESEEEEPAEENEEVSAICEGDLLVLKNRKEEEKLPLAQLIYMEHQNKKIRIVTKEGEISWPHIAMEKLEILLADHCLRCHRGYLVVKGQIADLDCTLWNLHLKDAGESIDVGKTYRASIRKWVWENTLRK